MQYLKIIAGINCQHCQGPTISYGKTGNKQRYYCKACKRTQIKDYTNQGCKACTAVNIALQVKEGCGIRSISRLLRISVNTVLKNIITIADGIEKPAIAKNRSYEADEIKTYVKRKTNEYWIIYAIDRDSKIVADFKIGKRNKKNIQRVADTLLLAECKKIYTDKLDIYNTVVPENIQPENARFLPLQLF